MSPNTTSGPMAVIPSAVAHDWLVERTRHAALELSECVETNPDKMGGTPVLKGTRISVAQILAELGEGRRLQDVADDFCLEVALLKKVVAGLAIYLDRPLVR